MKRKRSKRKAVREDQLMLLSPRESQVVELMGKGWSRAEISDRLGVSRKCVRVYKTDRGRIVGQQRPTACFSPPTVAAPLLLLLRFLRAKRRFF